MGVDTLQNLGEFVRNVGFPAAVAIWLLWQVRPRLDKLARGQRRIFRVLRTLAVMKCAGTDGELLAKIRDLVERDDEE